MHLMDKNTLDVKIKRAEEEINKSSSEGLHEDLVALSEVLEKKGGYLVLTYNDNWEVKRGEQKFMESPGSHKLNTEMMYWALETMINKYRDPVLNTDNNFLK